MEENFFKTQRDKIDRTQFQIAVAMGFTPSAVAAWEQGRAIPNLRHTAKLAQVYQVSEKRITDEIVELKKHPATAGK